MWVNWTDLDRRLAAFDHFRDQLASAFGGAGSSRERSVTSWPTAVLYDTGTAFVFKADVPGATEEGLAIDVHEKTLTVSAERTLSPPEGYSLHRNERRAFRFKKSFALPAAVDPERASAALQDGVLTITIDKQPEAKARRITISR